MHRQRLGSLTSDSPYKYIDTQTNERAPDERFSGLGERARQLRREVPNWTESGTTRGGGAHDLGNGEMRDPKLLVGRENTEADRPSSVNNQFTNANIFNRRFERMHFGIVWKMNPTHALKNGRWVEKTTGASQVQSPEANSPPSAFLEAF